MVRALIIIRELWMEKSATAGYPPILVLSYKNMAIDRFLVDLVKAEPRTLTSNKLIRIGGSCKDPRLAQFSERNVFHSDAQVAASRFTVEKLNKLRISLLSSLSGTVASFLSYYHLMFGDLDAKARSKAANEATEFLMLCIAKKHLFAVVEGQTETPGAGKPDGVMEALRFLETDENRRPHSDLKRLVERPSGSSFVAVLSECSTQCQNSHWGDILLMWLSGKRPLPRCAFRKEQDGLSACDSLAISHEIPFCDDHRCQGQGSAICVAPCASAISNFCLGHCCQFETCILERLPGKQKYCIRHACKRCIELDIVASLGSERPPRNVCYEHHICTLPSCLRLCAHGEIYCEEHKVVKCLASTKKGAPCKGQPMSRYKPYCRDHVHLAQSFCVETGGSDNDESDSDAHSDSDSDNSGSAPTRTPALIARPNVQQNCMARTTRGHVCKGSALPGLQYCYDHEPPSRNTSVVDLALSNEFGSSTALPNMGITEPLLEGVNNKKVDHFEMDEDVVSVSSKCSAASEVVQDKETTPLFTEADELEFDLEEGENLQHLREVFEVGDDESISSSSKTSDEGGNFDGQDNKSASSFYSSTSELIRCDPNSWTWDMPINERWKECQRLMGEIRDSMNDSLIKIKQVLVVARSDLQQAKMRAKARLYESKSVIGGTMVGCIARLESIRATRPFAVVVEEASEVLEPLLFSCLSGSTLKLEMIGDHRQLQPSVMSRYDFELCNKINVSMFQRLIEAPSGHDIPSTVLSVQRRMRKNICDLTRRYYEDVVEIEDHEVCGHQLLGQKLPQSVAKPFIGLTFATGGREVPGICPHVFLWTHDGKQGRARVGISRINDEEAERATAIAVYLVACGVPRSCTAVLSPYKGQLLLIRDKMLKQRLLSRDPSDEDVCRVSTVDRFQGDEEDVIICSLVVDEHSKTGFVKLQNRMVVLLSRARLGLYILANSGFLGNQVPSHWKNTLELLGSPGSDDAIHVLKDADVLTGTRSGLELPICCPIHRNVSYRAKNALEVKLGFCAVVCQDQLPCGHHCSLPCHWPNAMHNKLCYVKLDSPCQAHLMSVTCHQAFRNAVNIPSGTDYTNIMSFYKCPSKVSFRLPCNHTISLSCWEETVIISGSRSMPVCNQASPIPYTFAGCGHNIPVTCSQFFQYSDRSTLVRCEEEREFEPPCGHRKRMKCWKTLEYESGVQMYSCSEQVSETLPRCGHRHTVSCNRAQQFLKWTGKCCQEVGKIFEGETYGAHDGICSKNTEIVRKCLHNITLRCNEAFSQISSLPSCRAKLKSTNPTCGHPCVMACVDLKGLEKICIPIVNDIFREGQIPPLPNPYTPALAACTEMVKIHRFCGHVENIHCSQIRKPLRGCQSTVLSRSAICGHEVEVFCRLTGDFEKEIWAADTFFDLCSLSKLPQKAICYRDLSSISVETKTAFGKCEKERAIELKCGHMKIVKCSTIGNFFSSRMSDCIKCTIPVTVRLPCGHDAVSICCEVSDFDAADCQKITCSKLRSQECWNFLICHRRLQVPCSFTGKVACSSNSQWTCSATGSGHCFNIPLCSIGEPRNCPGCSTVRLQSTIQNPSIVPDPDLTPLVSDLLPECILPLRMDASKWADVEMKLLRQYEADISSTTEWDAPIFEYRKVACIRQLKGRNQSMDSFDPRIFAKASSMHGIITKLLTKPNLLKFAEKAEGKAVTLLLGYASVVRTKVLDVALPNGAKKRSAIVQSVFHEQFTSMLYFDKSCECLILWDPFPIVAQYRLTLSRDQLIHFADTVNNLPQQNFGPCEITYNPPPDDAMVVTSEDWCK